MTMIALVDDDQNIQTSLSKLFEVEGYRGRSLLATVSAALCGIAKFPARRGDIRCRHAANRWTGVAAPAAQSSNLPVILMTSADGEDDELAGFRLGCR